MTAALLDRLVYRSTILLLEGESYRFRQSLQRQAGRTPQPARRAEKGGAPDSAQEGCAMTADTGPCNGDQQVSVTIATAEEGAGT